MIYTIQNEFLTVRVEDLGAQLSSIQAPDGTEYLWQGDPDIWARRAPILFPFIARLRENTYCLDGQPYAISTHGFARDMVFSLVEQGEDHISLQLADTPETRKVYPFSFSLTVTYTLEGNRLKKSHRVENRSDKDMYYELGAHDGFRAPVEPGVPMSSWSIRLPGVERVQFYGMDESCTLTPKGEAIPLENGKLPLTPSTYGLDTMVLDRPPRATAQLVDGWGHPRVSVEFPDFDYLGLWTADKPFDTGYVCIEPWSSLPDATFVGRELSSKAGVRRLAPGQSEELSYLTTINHRDKEEKG